MAAAERKRKRQPLWLWKNRRRICKQEIRVENREHKTDLAILEYIVGGNRRSVRVGACEKEIVFIFFLLAITIIVGVLNTFIRQLTPQIYRVATELSELNH